MLKPMLFGPIKRHAAAITFPSTVIALFAATSAQALSCLPPDPVRMYQDADAAEIGYWIVKGQVTLLGELGKPIEGKDVDTPAMITGLGLHLDGSYRPFEQPVTVRQTCFGPWCGGGPGDEEQFLAIAVTDDGPVLSIDPCSGNLAPITPEGESRLLACVRDGVCKSEYP